LKIVQHVKVQAYNLFVSNDSKAVFLMVPTPSQGLSTSGYYTTKRSKHLRQVPEPPKGSITSRSPQTPQPCLIQQAAQLPPFILCLLDKQSWDSMITLHRPD